MEAYPDAKTDFTTYRIWCNSCPGYKTWTCDICNKTMLCVKDDEESLCLRCPKCGYGYRFIEPVKSNSPQTNDGWRLLRGIALVSSYMLERNPYKVLEVVTHYEKNQGALSRYPEDLAMNLRRIGVWSMDADKIASAQLHTTVRTAYTILSSD